MSATMDRLIKEKRQAVEDLKIAEKKRQDAIDLRNQSDKHLGGRMNEIQELKVKIENLNAVIQEQKEEVLKAHGEVDEANKSREFWKGRVDRLVEKFGSIENLEDQIRIANLKE